MSRRLILVVVAAAIATPSIAAADDSSASSPQPTNEHHGRPHERAISAELGLGAGGGYTVGGAKVTGRFLYQLTDDDWFENSVHFTFGGGGAACFRDRDNAVICEHGLADGKGVEVVSGLRRYFRKLRRAGGALGGDQGVQYLPFARAAMGIGLSHFSADDATGLVIPLHVGGGLRAVINSKIAIVAVADLQLGVGIFGSNIGAAPQFGFGVSAGVEFNLD